MTNKERVTAKSVIREAILAGKTTAAILKIVAKKMPDSAADELHIRKYVNELFKEGKLDMKTRDKYYTSGRKRPETSGAVTTGKTSNKKKAVVKKKVAKKGAVTKAKIKKRKIKK